MKTFLLAGAILGFIGVAAGAFGAHGLRPRLSPQDFDTFEVAVRYQMYHALGLFAVGWIGSQAASGLANAAGWLFIAGVLVFSGSLYLLVLTDTRWLGAVTPIGGVAFLAGWVCLGLAASKI